MESKEFKSFRQRIGKLQLEKQPSIQNICDAFAHI